MDPNKLLCVKNKVVPEFCGFVESSMVNSESRSGDGLNDLFGGTTRPLNSALSFQPRDTAETNAE